MRLADGKLVATFAAANASAPGGGLSLKRGGGVISWLCLDDSPLLQPQRACNASLAAVQAASGCGDGGCLLLLSVDDLAAAAPLAANAQLLANPSDAAPQLAFRGNLSVSCGVAPAYLPDGSLPLFVSFPADTPQTAQLALLVVLTSAASPGRFTDNGFALIGGALASAASAAGAPPVCAGTAGPCAARVAAAADGAAPPTLSFVPWTEASGPRPAAELAAELLAGLRVQHLGQYSAA